MVESGYDLRENVLAKISALEALSIQKTLKSMASEGNSLEISSELSNLSKCNLSNVLLALFYHVPDPYVVLRLCENLLKNQEPNFQVRLLTRLVAFMQENPNDDFVFNLFWKVSEDSENSQSASHRLLHAIMGLLFLPDFTIPSSSYSAFKEQNCSNCPNCSSSSSTPSRLSQSPNPSLCSCSCSSQVFAPLLWCSGVGYPDASMSVSSLLDKNRKEVLKLLLVCFSGNLYYTSDSQHQQNNNKWLSVATNASCPFLPTLFHSLLNVIITYNPVGWGVPYVGAVLTDEREFLVDISLQVFLVLLDYDDIEGKHENMYKKILSSLNRKEDFDLLYGGITKLLNNVHQSLNTYLPNSIKQIQCYQELLVLLWKLLDDNPEFLKYVVEESDLTQVVVPLLFLMHQGRKEPSKVGLIHICTFILLLLSGEREFCVLLNKNFDQKLPTDLPPFAGNHLDLIIIVLHKLIINGYEKLNSVYNCFLTIISNISPYCRKLGLVSSIRLVRLFKLFSQPCYLYDNEANHHLVFFLLDIFNNILQYQYEGNSHLVYAIVQNKELFTDLNNLVLPQKQLQTSSTEQEQAFIKKQQLLKEQQDEKEQQEETSNQEQTSNQEEQIAEEEERNLKERQEQVLDAPEILEESAVIPSSSFSQEQSKFIATKEWAEAWKAKLPLATTLRLLQYLVPQIDQLVAKSPGGTLDESVVLAFIRGTTVVGLLPVPHPIIIRKYQPNPYTNLWFTTFTWGIIFLRNQALPLFDGTTIKLFTINVL